MGSLNPIAGQLHGETARVKIDFTYDLLTANMITHTLELATIKDKSIEKETLIETQSGDLFLRYMGYMGYFYLSEFREIEKKNTYWLRRLPLTTNVFCANGKALEKFLQNKKSNLLDLDVQVGNEQKTAASLLCEPAKKLPENAVANEEKKPKNKAKPHASKL